jgi:hypothetical protein
MLLRIQIGKAEQNREILGLHDPTRDSNNNYRTLFNIFAYITF